MTGFFAPMRHAENSGFRNELALRSLRFDGAGRSIEADTGLNSPTLLISGVGFQNPTHATRTSNTQANFLTEPSAIKPRLSRRRIFLPLELTKND
jgi:hypothetical protein